MNRPIHSTQDKEVPRSATTPGAWQLEDQMQQQSTSIALEALEAVCDVLDAVGSDRLPRPLTLTRHRLHQALGMTGEASVGDICSYLTISLSDIASETRREDPFSSSGVVLSSSQERAS